MDTIIAQATPSGQSAVAIIRVSGYLCTEIYLQSCGWKTLHPRHVKLANYRDLEGNLLDQVLITFFEKGKSYTGEDLIEISCHGNPLISELICEDLIKRGCRFAKPGEFTKLAFINGKLDLSQAESVAQIISAKSNQSLIAAQRNLKGDLSSELLDIQDQILKVQANIEAYIDFPEDDIGNEDNSRIKLWVQNIESRLESLLNHATKTNTLQKNIRIALIGLPNAGKSSLFNEIIGKKRALVHEQSGTTRDYIEMDVKLGTYWVTLIDTAGVHQTQSAVEKEGIRMTNEQIQYSDLILWVVDNSIPYPTGEQNQFSKIIKEKPTILVKNKIDLPKNQPTQIKEKIHTQEISCTSRLGIKELMKVLEEMITDIYGKEGDGLLYIGKRHEQLIKHCLKEILTANNAIRENSGYELISTHLSSARESIDEMIGIKTNENMLDELFGQFCIGK